jgi:3-methyladenine DNA glycosylase/8-oxoguanine DNA glycosylase
MKLSLQAEIYLNPSIPFNFEGTFHKPSHFESNDVLYIKDTFWQSMRFKKNAYGLKFINFGKSYSPKLKLEIYSQKIIPDAIQSEIINEVEFRYDLNADMQSFNDQCGNDILFANILERWNGMRISVNTSLYEFLVITTVLQNTTIKRTIQMFGNLFKNYGSEVTFDEKTIAVIWKPEVMVRASEEELRALKLGYRAKTIIKQANEILSGEYNEYELRKLPSVELKNRLLNLYGIGPASVWYLMFEVFKRYEVFDYISPWEQKIYSKVFFDKELVDSEIILKEAESRWGKWKMLAVHYIFEDLFWQRKNRNISWLDKLIRL